MVYMIKNICTFILSHYEIYEKKACKENGAETGFALIYTVKTFIINKNGIVYV